MKQNLRVCVCVCVCVCVQLTYKKIVKEFVTDITNRLKWLNFQTYKKILANLGSPMMSDDKDLKKHWAQKDKINNLDLLKTRNFCSLKDIIL
jgi:hypothetical protein